MTGKNSIPQFVNSESFMADRNYVKWLSDLKKRIRVAQLKAAVNVNVEMLKFYWSLGEDICDKQKQYKWGARIIDKLSLDLRSEFPKSEGFPRANLFTPSTAPLLGKVLLRKVFGQQQRFSGSESTSNFDTCSVGIH